MSKGFAQKAILGPQSTLHTLAATPPTILRHPASMIQDTRQPEVPPEIQGFHIRPVDRTYTPAIAATWAMGSGAANFEENLPYVLSSGIVDQNTGTADGSASSGYTRTFSVSGASNTAQNTPMYTTVQTGDDTQGLEMEDGIVTDFNLTFAQGAALMLDANWAGRQAAIGTLYASAAVTAGPEDILSNKGSLQIGNTGGTFGSLTSKTSTLLSGSISVTTGYKWRTTLDGALYPTDIIFDGEAFSAEISVVYVHNSNAVTELAAWRAESLRMFQLQFLGSAYGTAGSGTYFSGYKGLDVKAVGKYTSFSAVERSDGSSIVSATLTCGWSIADNAALTFVLANEDSALAAAS